MEVVPLHEPAEVAALAADIVEEQVRRRPATVLGVATGSSPMATYTELIRRHRAGTGPSYGDVTTFTLDEYVGLPDGDPQGYRTTILRELACPLGVPQQQVAAPDPTASGLPTAGERYEDLLANAGGVDLQILGIGANGHLAFNEPGSSLASRTRIKTLTAKTRQDNARFFHDIEDVPRHVLTQGLGTILDARHLLLIATGHAKARAVAAAVEGPLTASCPASILQMHRRVTVLVDSAASRGLARLAYYLDVWHHKPDWQRPGG
ncbi:MAG: glucosamine-6-phosphate deaminase [Nocardioidaceae bacterium]|nr:glucosamine-6-phosphate deaminase [Nocardioidaceae bacterium]MCL2613585.1 glucosamine-6-phosphate deaminase [Nocardioidaceae bacterium]